MLQMLLFKLKFLNGFRQKKEPSEMKKKIFEKEVSEAENLEFSCFKKFLKILCVCFSFKKQTEEEFSKNTVSTEEEESPKEQIPDSERNLTG